MTFPSSRPRWSPQGDRIVYSTVANGIWSVPSLGGEPRQIIRDGRNADLSRDGRRLVFERAGEMFIAGADGSDTRVLPRPAIAESLLCVTPGRRSRRTAVNRGLSCRGGTVWRLLDPPLEWRRASPSHGGLSRGRRTGVDARRKIAPHSVVTRGQCESVAGVGR